MPAQSGAKTTRGVRLANMLFAELINYGWVLTADLVGRIACLPEDVLLRVVRSHLDAYTVGSDVQLNPPLFRNWEARDEFTFEERVVQILGYLFQFAGRDLEDPGFVQRVHSDIEFTDLKPIRAMSDEEVREHFLAITNTSTALDRPTLDSVALLMRVMGSAVQSMPRVRSAEIRISALMELCQRGPVADALTWLKCDPVDAVRYAAVLGEDDIEGAKLPAGIHFPTLPWQQRRALFTWLDARSFEELAEAMGLNRDAWVRFTRTYHLLSQRQFRRLRNVRMAVMASQGHRLETISDKRDLAQVAELRAQGLIEVTEAGAMAYRTFASRMQSAIDAQAVPVITMLCKERPGYVMRNLTTVLRGIPSQGAIQFLEMLEEDILPRTAASTLLALLQIDPSARWRVVDAKGKTELVEANYGTVFERVQIAIRRAIRLRFGLKGQVRVTDTVRNRVPPFLARNSNLERGTRVRVPEGHRFLYLFMHWVQSESSRTDLDLSAVAFDASGNAEHVAYYCQAEDWATHSGDLTDAPAPEGSTEYVRIDLERMRHSGHRYCVPMINVFCGERFAELPVARAGFLTSDSQQFRLSQEHTAFDLDAESRFNVPFVYDRVRGELVLLDYNQSSAARTGSNSLTFEQTLWHLIDAVGTTRRVTIGEIAELISGDSSEDELLITSDSVAAVSDSVRHISPEQMFTLFE